VLVASDCVTEGKYPQWVGCTSCEVCQRHMQCPTREAGHTQQLARQAVQAIQHATRCGLQVHPLWVAGELSLLLQE
jgi:hypothetical protein